MPDHRREPFPTTSLPDHHAQTHPAGPESTRPESHGTANADPHAAGASTGTAAADHPASPAGLAQSERSGPVRVILVDDDPLTRSAVRQYLRPPERYSVVAEAADGLEAIDAVTRHPADVVLMDLGMPRMDGVEAIRRICSRPAHPAIVALTTWDVDDAVVRAVEAGAAGYLLKVEAPNELESTLERVVCGEPALSAGAMRRLMEHVRRQARPATGGMWPPEPVPGAAQLTERELAAVREVAQGLTTDQAAERLYISASTLKTHLTSAQQKVGARNRTHLAVLVQKAGLLG